MVFLIVAAMFILLIFISYLIEKRNVVSKKEATVGKANVIEKYIHPSHSFVSPVINNVAEIGMDEFSQRAFGSVEVTDLPDKGSVMKQGEKAWTLKVGDRSVSQRMPVDGQIMEVDPSAKKWILRVKPENFELNIANLIKGSAALTWLKKARAQFVADYSGELLPALQDGGELVEGFARFLNDDQWKVFCNEFFNCEK